MREFAVAEWQRAMKTLATAKLLEQTDPDSAVSRAYYAAFHALSAVFAFRGQRFGKHSAIRAALHRDLIKPGLLDPRLGQDFDSLTEFRETADYGGDEISTLAHAAASISAAERFVAAMKVVCPDFA